jgi:hypothetical protein
MKSIEPPFCLEGKSSERSTVPNSRNLQVSLSDFQFFPKLKTQLLKGGIRHQAGGHEV